MSLPELIPSDLPVFVRKSSRADFASSIVPEGAALLFAQSDSHSGVRFITKNSDGTYKEVGGGADITLGVVDSNGKFQPLKFDGTDASESGEPETVVNYKSWNSTYPPPGPVPSMNFYKCASVDTSNSEWSGHLAVISDSTGIWYFSSDSTSLVYDRLTPVVGNVYDEKCSFMVINYKAGLPMDGLVFYAPLNSLNTSTPTGQTLSFTGTLSVATYQGIQALLFSGNEYITFSDSDLPASGPLTASVWMNQQQALDGEALFFYGGDQAYFYLAQNYYNKIDYNIENYGGRVLTDSNTISDDVWFNIIATWDVSGAMKLYVNGVLKGTDTYSTTIAKTGTASIAKDPHNHFHGYLASVRVYNRVLSDDEISALANEFHPTAS